MAPSLTPTQLLGSLVDLVLSPVVVREDAADGRHALLSVNVDAAPLALAPSEVATVRCTSESDSVTIDAPSSHAVRATSSGAMSIGARGANDIEQSASRTAEVVCEVTAGSRPPQRFPIAVTVLGVAQPSFALLCPLPHDADPLAATPATCGASATTNGNMTLLIIGGSAAAGCPQPPFDATASSSAMSVTIGGVRVAVRVVAGSMGTRLLTTTPTIAALQAARGAAVDAFDFKYYGVTITTAAGAHGALSGSVAVGAGEAADARTGKQAFAARGLCPDVPPQSAGLYYSDQCVGYADPAIDTRWDDEAFATLFAYGRPPRCRACPVGCRCPGGNRCRPIEGYYIPAAPGAAKSEDLGDAVRCSFLLFDAIHFFCLLIYSFVYLVYSFVYSIPGGS